MKPNCPDCANHICTVLGRCERVAELVSAAADALSGWRYIRRNHGDLYGVGWDRVEGGLVNALAAQGMETRRAKTEGLGAKHDSPVAESDAPEPGVAEIARLREKQ